MADRPSHETLDSLRAERDAWAQELFESNRYAAELAVARQALADALATADARARSEAAAATATEIAAAHQTRDAALAERDRARAEAHEAEAKLARILSSTSWRLTAPLRAALTRLRARP